MGKKVLYDSAKTRVEYDAELGVVHKVCKRGFNAELHALQAVQSIEHAVPLISWSAADRSITMPYFQKTLEQVLTQDQEYALWETYCEQWIACLLAFVEGMTANGLVHGDLKAKNILVRTEASAAGPIGEIRVCDFEMMRSLVEGEAAPNLDPLLKQIRKRWSFDHTLQVRLSSYLFEFEETPSEEAYEDTFNQYYEETILSKLGKSLGTPRGTRRLLKEVRRYDPTIKLWDSE